MAKRKDGKDPQDPSVTSHFYDVHAPTWDKVSTLLAGTESMRAAGETYLPQYERESKQNYRYRRDVAVLFNQTELTLKAWVGRPFSDPVRVGKDTPEDVAEHLKDIDLYDNNVSVFAREWFKQGLAKGLHYVMVDMPAAGDEPRTAADDIAEDVRPYWVSIPAHDVLGIKKQTAGGKTWVTQLRVREFITVDDGFIEDYLETIRVYDLMDEGYVRVTVYRLVKDTNDKREFEIMGEPMEMDIDEIPLVTFYADEPENGIVKPPLLDMVNLNIRHWQSSSDQNVILDVARFPILAATGVDGDESLEIGPRKALTAHNPQAKFYYVEHQGMAIEAGNKELRNLESQMAEYGAQFLKRQPGSQTATARALDSAEATSPLQDVIMRFNDALAQAMAYHMKWLGREDEDALIEVTTDLGPELVSGEDFRALLDSRRNGDISRPAFLEELKRRGVLSDEFDIKADEQRLESEKDSEPEQQTQEEEDGAVSNRTQRVDDVLAGRPPR